jgi:membrane protease YdiL (CAAX protease family)
MIHVSWVLVRRTGSGRALADRLAGAVCGIPMPDAIMVAILAGVSEELLFRGCLWFLIQSLLGPWVALAATSMLFAAVHGAFRKGYGLWGLFALGGGLVSGVLLILTGNLVAPIAMHVLTDAVNLPLLVRHARPCDDR